MKTTATRLTMFGTSLMLGTLSAMPAQAETTACMEITTIPTMITTQGVHCLKAPIGINPGLMSGTAIDVMVNNVVIDFNGFKLGNKDAGTATTATGIRGVDRDNVTIKNGIIRGFARGISFEVTSLVVPSTSSGIVVEDMIVDDSTVEGIWVEGTGHTVQRNRVLNTGGSTATDPGDSIGIYAAGPNHRILYNDVTEVLLQGSPTGIFVSAGNGSVALGNRITNAEQLLSESVVTLSDGITVGSSIGVFVTGNHISNYQHGIHFSTASGIYSNNKLFGMDTNYTGGTDGGNNFP